MNNPIRIALVLAFGATLMAIIYLAVGQPFSGTEQISANYGSLNLLIPLCTTFFGALARDLFGDDEGKGHE